MFFETHDGTRLAYEEYGTGEPIVFIAGAMLNTDMWEYQIPFFVDRGYRCIAIDRRGHGRSDRPATGYDIDTTTEDLAALLDHLDLRDATLVGHSTGGAEAARYVARHGNARVARVVFLAAILPFMKLTDDNPGGVPEEIAENLFQQIRTDRGSGWPGRPRRTSPPTWATTSPSNRPTPPTASACPPRRGPA